MQIEEGYTEKSQFLKNFLVEHGAFEKFIKAMNDEGIRSFNAVADDGDNAFIWSFTWCVTQDGYDYWDELDAKFCYAYKEHFKEV